MPRAVSNRRSKSAPSRNDPPASVAGSALRRAPSSTVNAPCSGHSSARIDSSPRSRTYRWMADALNEMAARQIAPRRCQGKSTAHQMTAQTEHNHRAHAAATRADATMSILRTIRLHGAAQSREMGIFGDIARDEITRNVGVGQFEKFHEGSAFVTCRESELIS